MSAFFRIVKLLVFLWLKRRASDSIGNIELKLSRTYLKTVESFQEGLFLIMLMALGILLFILALALLVVGFLFWSPWSLETKGLFLGSLGVLSLVISLSLIFYAKSEAVWIRIFGVDKLVSWLSSRRD